MGEINPRLLTEEEARVYLAGCNPRSVLPPVYLGRAPRWDREALDRRLDEMAGIAATVPTHEPDSAEAAAAQWRRSRHGAASGRS
jgi:hypothetical protein